VFRKPFGGLPRFEAAASRPMAADIHEALARLLPRWHAEGADLLPPVPASDVRGVFRRLGAVATPDVIALYGAVGGMRCMDDSYFCLWSLEQIAAQERSDSGLVFADYLISSWEYRLVPTLENQSAVCVNHFNGTPPGVGPTLEAFLITMENDPEFLHGFH
jgi:hypothetical protein